MSQPIKSQSLVCTAALLALSVAVGAGITPVAGSSSERRSVVASQDPAVASLLACFSEAAKNIAGSKAPAFTSESSRLLTARPAIAQLSNVDVCLIATQRVSLSLLNLPPPVAS